MAERLRILDLRTCYGVALFPSKTFSHCWVFIRHKGLQVRGARKTFQAG